jgi:hypothetical protein
MFANVLAKRISKFLWKLYNITENLNCNQMNHEKRQLDGNYSKYKHDKGSDTFTA